MYGLAPADLDIQRRAREFTDELIPFEQTAEEYDGQLPRDVSRAHHALAIERGLYATNMPTSVGGQGCTTLQQVLVQEQAGRVTNGLAWCLATPPAWWPAVANDHQRATWLLPTVRGEMQECYAITEEDAGSDVSELKATARRDGDGYVLDGVKWHVTSFNHAAYAFFQAVLTAGPHAGDQALFVVDTDAPGVRVVRTPTYTHTLDHHHPIVAFENVRVPATHLVGNEDDGMAFVYEWFRFERLMVAARCLGAAERLVDEATAFAKERLVGGVPLMERQLVQAMLADSLTELFAARADDLRDGAVGRRRSRREGASMPSARWRSCMPPRWPAGWPTEPCRSSAVAATCARTSPSGSSASSGWNGSGRAPARCSG